MRARFPRLIYGDLGAFGHRGPLSDRPGYELLLQAFGGLMSITGEPGREGVRCGPSLNDLGTGIWAAIGILAALIRRGRTGEGCLIEASLFETALCWGSIHAASYLASGEAPRAEGASHPSLTPYGAFETADGRLIIGAGNDQQFADSRVRSAIPNGRAIRFRSNPERVAIATRINALIADVVKAQTREHWQATLDAAGVPCAPMLGLDEVLAHPQSRALGMLQDAPDGGMR